MSGAFEKEVIFPEMLSGPSLPSHRVCDVVLRRVQVQVLEMEDVLFHHDSAVMMPESPVGRSSSDGERSTAGNSAIDTSDEEVSGLKALVLVFKQLQFDPEKRIVVAGHTDTSGEVRYNFELSELRAKNVLYLLIGQRPEWAQISCAKHKVEDYQQIMKYFSETRGWPCDPGPVDDRWGDRTEDATRGFITAYNVGFADPYGCSRLSVDLIETIKKDARKRWPEALWAAVFDLYSEDVAHVLGVSLPGLEELRRRTFQGKFADEGKKFVACGESFPIDEPERRNYRSQSNRRVGILFFDRKEAPRLDCPIDVGSIHTSKDCPLWHRYLFVPRYLDRSDLYVVTYHLSFKYYDRIAKKLRDVPDGLVIRAYENGTRELATQSKYKDGAYAVKVRFDRPLDDPGHRSLHFEFETEDAWLYTSSEDAEPQIVHRPQEQVKGLDFLERLKYYDLPRKWSSRNWWTRYKRDMEKGQRFEEVLENPAVKGPSAFRRDAHGRK